MKQRVSAWYLMAVSAYALAHFLREHGLDASVVSCRDEHAVFIDPRHTDELACARRLMQCAAHMTTQQLQTFTKE